MTQRFPALAALLTTSILLSACEGASDMEFDPSLAIDESALVRSDSGLRYQLLSEGVGAVATAGNEVEISYRGSLTNGTLFDEGSFSFTLGSGMVVAGFDEGITGMTEGERRTLVIPPELGYGETGAGGGLIPPGATLVFEVELLRIVS